MRLGRKQEIFATHFAILVLIALARPHYEGRIDAVKRSAAEAKRLGMGMSLHRLRLAGDLLLFKRGRYLETTEAYEWLGRIWEGFSGEYEGEYLEFCWGGRFADGNHFSIAHNGRK